jgi:4-hydroxy-3-methylbut-2-enyl diphosphate reductase
MSTQQAMVAFPRGFCAGVRRAVDAVEAALLRFPTPIYCFHEIVHNRQVVDRLSAKGVVFVHDLDEVPSGGVVLFSAHGVTPQLRADAQQRGLTVIDATCPFVAKVHAEVKRFAQDGYTIVLIGKRGHEEVVGVAGEAPEHVVVVEDPGEARTVDVADPLRVAVVMQTTLSQAEAGEVLGALRHRFPGLKTPPNSDICYATTNRQEAVRQLSEKVERVLVLGARNSANTNRLVEVARKAGTIAELLPDMDSLEKVDFAGVKRVGVTAGASTPESFLDAVMAALAGRGFEPTSLPPVAEESVTFTLPPPLCRQSESARM